MIAFYCCQSINSNVLAVTSTLLYRGEHVGILLKFKFVKYIAEWTGILGVSLCTNLTSVYSMSWTVKCYEEMLKSISALFEYMYLKNGQTGWNWIILGSYLLIRNMIKKK